MDQSSAIRDLQRMLSQLSRRFPAIPRPAVTGVFDETTLEAVMVFQRDFALPVTGVVNEATWDKIKLIYLQDDLLYGVPMDLRVLPDGIFTSNYGDKSYPMFVSEALFSALSTVISNFSAEESTGVNSGINHDNIRTLQALAGLSVDGILNRSVWEFLTRLYHIFITRGDQKIRH